MNTYSKTIEVNENERIMNSQEEAIMSNEISQNLKTDGYGLDAGNVCLSDCSNDPLMVLGSLYEEIIKVKSLLESIDKCTSILNCGREYFKSTDLINKELDTLLPLIDVLKNPVNNIYDIILSSAAELKDSSNRE